MDITTFSIAFIISYLGIGVGIALSYIAKEELKAGKKYFILMQDIIFAIIVGVLMISFYFYWYWTVPVVLAMFWLSYKFEKQFGPSKSTWFYPLLGILFFASSFKQTCFLINSSLIFIYGFPTGSLLFNHKEKNYGDLVVRTISFAIALVLFILIN